MQHKKIASILAIAVLSLATPFYSIPKAHAFDDNIQYAMTGVQSYSDPLFGTVQTARDGSTVILNVVIDASDFGSAQQNVTVGVKFDWMTSWVNATNADTDSTLAITRNQYVVVQVSVTLPTLTGAFANFHLYSHSWQARVWTGALNAPVTSPPHDSSSTTSFALYHGEQADGMAARAEAQDKIDALSLALALPVLATPPPGWSKAVSDNSQAQASIDRGNAYYQSRNFGAAKTQYQNALNLANSAAGALSGGESGTFFSSWFSGVGWLLAGAGALLVGLGGFMYLRRRKQ